MYLIVVFLIKKKRKGVIIIITKEMRKRIHRMAILTWDTIADDVLNLIEEEESLSREDVIDWVSDCSYMFYHGKDHDAYKIWDKLPGDEKVTILEDAFIMNTKQERKNNDTES